ncbi:MAG: hypothetical protein ACYDB2_11365 [Acidimicrobiales bacterium]
MRRLLGPSSALQRAASPPGRGPMSDHLQEHHGIEGQRGAAASQLLATGEV